MASIALPAGPSTPKSVLQQEAGSVSSGNCEGDRIQSQGPFSRTLLHRYVGPAAPS